MRHNYFTLCEKIDNAWCAQFGDYDRATVRAEMADLNESGVRSKNLKIIQSLADQKAINADIAALNKKVQP